MIEKNEEKEKKEKKEKKNEDDYYVNLAQFEATNPETLRYCHDRHETNVDLYEYVDVLVCESAS